MDLEGRTVLYRGSLKSCNYRCSYCPFSKHPRSERELLKDREQWMRFWPSLLERAGNLGIRALMVVPYGEALIHPWYWQGLGRLAESGYIDAVGAQTNLSFSVESALEMYERAGGDFGKLRLWATFHPEMTTVEKFAETCRQIHERGILLCAGAVGAVENRQVITELRERLPGEIYLWINRMDGLGRRYTREETEAFEAVDAYFGRELEWVSASCDACRDRLFAEGDGRLRRCVISRPLTGNWYDVRENQFAEGRQEGEGSGSCGRKICSCYLAYGGRGDMMNRILFGPYPLFRIPRRPKAVFLDIDGFLIPGGETHVSGRMEADVRALAMGGSRLFFATSLPLREAKRKCREIWELFGGGVFACGAHTVLEGEMGEREVFLALEKGLDEMVGRQQKRYGCRMTVYRDGDSVYKITLVRPKHMGWKEEETKEVGDMCRQWAVSRPAAEAGEKEKGDRVRCFAEENCLEIVSSKASKARGVKRICGWLGISPREAAAGGDSPEDAEMTEMCGLLSLLPVSACR